jgi:hypothetical protein
MATYPFLSDEWIAEARKIREEYRGSADMGGTVIRMNQVITDVPFGDGTIKAHMDTSSGEPELDLGHLDKPDVQITVDYATAKAIFVQGDVQAAMQAFMGGRIKVDGDLSKLLALQQVSPDASALELQQRIMAITSSD